MVCQEPARPVLVHLADGGAAVSSLSSDTCHIALPWNGGASLDAVNLFSSLRMRGPFTTICQLGLR